MKQFKTVEEYLELIAGYRDVVSGIRNPLVYFFSPIINLARYDNDVLDSMSQASIDGKALTERQGQLAIKIILKYKRQLAAKLIDVAPIEEDPVFRATPRKMDYRKSLFIKDDKLFAKFPYDTKLIESIRTFKKESQGECEFLIDEKLWKFGLTEFNLNWAHTVAVANGFDIDGEVTMLVQQVIDIEKTPYLIELFVDGDELNITNCPLGLREYINDTLGGFAMSNLLRLADSAGELGFTIRDNLLAALKEQYGATFVKMAVIKEAKLSNITSDKFVEILEYARLVNRGPVVIYEPNKSGILQSFLYSSGIDGHYQIIDTKKCAIDPDAEYIHTTNTIRDMEYIPLLITTAGMIFGSDKQIMFQRAGKVLYLTPEVYRGSAESPKPTVENLDF